MNNDSSNNNKVFLHIEGGGWCCDTCYETCFERSKTSLCSTVNDTSNTLGDFAYEKAYYDMNRTINPAVWDFTSVYVRYCDSKYDAWQLDNELGYASIYNTSAAAIDDVNQYGTALVDELMTAINSQRILQPKSKIFLSSCEFHTVLGGLNDSDEDLNKVWLKASINGTTVNLAFNEWLSDVLRRPIDDNNIDNNDQLESDLVSDEVFPCEECCDIVLYEESSSSSSSSSSKNDLFYYQANRFRAVVVVVVVSVAAML